MTARTLDQAVIWYSACNEDTASEIAALQPQGKRVLCITASGSRAFGLLLADPAEVVSIDQNPAQTALVELFAAAYAAHEYADFCVLAGLREGQNRAALAEALLPRISPSAQAFWTCNRHLVANGLLYCGRWEGFLRRFKRWAGERRDALAQRLLSCPNVRTQQALWYNEWDDWQWRLFLRALACRPLWRWGLREPGIAFVPRDFSISAYIGARFDHAARNLHMAKLPFAHLLLEGAYSPEILPPYLTPDGHAVIRNRLDRLKLKTASLQETLAVAEPDSFDGASLSDYSSYCDTAEQRQVWRDLARRLRSGGRVCERKFLNKSGLQLPLETGFSRDTDLEKRLDAEDGAWVYSFVVAKKLQATRSCPFINAR